MHNILDCITPLTMQGYTFDLDLEQLGYLGVPTDKIVLGLMPGHIAE